MHPGKRPLVLLLVFTALLAAAVAMGDPLTLPMPRYMDNIREWAAQGRIVDTFTPLAYPFFAGVGYRIAGVPGLLVLQALLHIAIAATAYAILRHLQLSPRWSAVGALPLALHPDLLTSVAKTWDVAFSTELYLLIALTLLQLTSADRERALTLLHSLAAGAVLGAGMSSRPNFLLLAPVLLWAAYRAPAQATSRRLLAACMLAVFAAATFLALGAAEHGRPFFPGNGPYNLYAGHNEFTAQALIQQENAETSIVPAYKLALRADPGLPKLSENSGDYYAPGLQPFYTHSSLTYAAHHSATEAKLVVIKLFTLFRPDTKVHRLASAGGLAKAILAIPILLLAVALLWQPRVHLHAADYTLLLLDALYIVPFLLTNADPRFRTPLDALLILQAIRLLWLRQENLATYQQPGGPDPVSRYQVFTGF